jgi:predicted nucleic acid-binding protein
MADKVVDASALAALAFAEPEADAVIDQIDGHRLHAPALIVFELMSVAWNRAKKQPAAAGLFLEALEVLDGLGLRLRGIDQREVVRLGLSSGLTAYDATYLWLARALNLPLVTLDKKLGAQAKKIL